MDKQLIERAVEKAAKADYRRRRPKGPGLDVDPDVIPPVFSDIVRPIVMAALAEVEASIKVQALREAADWLDHEDRAAGILEPDVAGLDAYRLRERADRIEAGESE